MSLTASDAFVYCPCCARPLIDRTDPATPGVLRRACPDVACGFVHWDNPTPVVAAVVEHEGALILARNKAWAAPFYALITGFLERTDPSPEEAIVREVKEELDLDATAAHFIGHYRFERQNQLILAYHVPATGVITLGEELIDYKRVPPRKGPLLAGGHRTGAARLADQPGPSAPGLRGAGPAHQALSGIGPRARMLVPTIAASHAHAYRAALSKHPRKRPPCRRHKHASRSTSPSTSRS